MANPLEKQPSPKPYLQEAKEALMTAEEYAQIEHERPYVFEAEKENKSVTFFGIGHSWDKDDPAWEQLKGSFKQADPDLVLVEGYTDIQQAKDRIIEEVPKMTEDEVISKAGETGITLKLAAEHGADFDSPEPPDAEHYKQLEAQGFSQEGIFAQQMFQMIPQWQQYENKGDFKPFIQKYIDRFKQDTQWKDFDYSYEHLEKINQNLWGEPINLQDPKYYKDKVDPIPWDENKATQTELNRISEASSVIRDQYIIEKIDEYLDNHDRIFIVYGASHAVMQEPAIKKLMEGRQHA